MLVMIALKMTVMNNDDEIVNAIEIMRMITYKIAIMIVLIIIMTTIITLLALLFFKIEMMPFFINKFNIYPT